LIDADDKVGIAIYIFKGSGVRGRLTESEEGTLEWVQRGRLADLPLVEDLRTILPMVLDRPVTEGPFSARYYYDEHDRMQIEFGV
jgi:hypothetical protein